LLLHATVEELVRRYLVFPSQFNRDYEDAPEPKGKAVAITFDGPVQSLYSTLAVRLGRSGLLTTGRAEMRRNAAVFTAKAGGKCGLFLHEFAEGRGRLILFFPDEHSSAETRFHFEEFALAHARRRALDGTVDGISLKGRRSTSPGQSESASDALGIKAPSNFPPSPTSGEGGRGLRAPMKGLRTAIPLKLSKKHFFLPNIQVSDGSQPPLGFYLFLSESAGSRSPDRRVCA
jgi:hypothetical protein